MTTIRPAHSDDADRIAAIWNGIIRATALTFTTEEKQAESLAATIAPARWLVAERDGAVAGFACYGAFRGGPGYRHTAELSIYLAEARRGAGAGGPLLAALEDAARAEDIHVLVAGISSENPGSIRCFARHGYAETGRLPEVGHKFGRWLDLVLMQKIL